LTAVVSAIVLLVALALLVAFYDGSARGPKVVSKPPVVTELEPVSEPSPATPTAEKPARPPIAEPSPAPSASALPDPTSLDETSLMAQLRELRGSNPELTLKLAREAQARFRNSPDAAEQSWFVVKSLTDLGRHDEARVEGKKLVKGYPGTRWAEDAHRHLFVNPATHPGERGYGKDLDL
jgi:hypothetical protein